MIVYSVFVCFYIEKYERTRTSHHLTDVNRIKNKVPNLDDELMVDFMV